MIGFKLVEHTADIGINASGATINEAFAGVAMGLFSVIADLSSIKERMSRLVVIDGPDVEGLLFNWINELIYIFEIERALFCRFEVIELTDNYIKVTCYGEKYDPELHQLKTEVKSATFHQMEIDRENCSVRVFLDV